MARSVIVARPGEKGPGLGRSAAQRVKDKCSIWREGEEGSLMKEVTGVKGEEEEAAGRPNSMADQC